MMEMPSKCPYCGKDYLAINSEQYLSNGSNQIFFEDCSFCNNRIYFICDYDRNLLCQYPVNPFVNISKEIAELSPSFKKCYEESIFALSYKLNDLVGVGLRKALEHLVTDYLAKIQSVSDLQNFKLWKKIDLLDKNLYATASANIVRLIGNDYTHVENLNGAELNELIDNIDLTVELMTTRLKSLKAETRLLELNQKK